MAVFRDMLFFTVIVMDSEVYPVGHKFLLYVLCKHAVQLNHMVEDFYATKLKAQSYPTYQHQCSPQVREQMLLLA